MTFKRPLGARRHPQTTTVRPLIHYVTIPVLGLKQRVSCSDWVTPTPGHLRVLRTDAAVVGQICAGVEVAKVTRLLIFLLQQYTVHDHHDRT